MDVWRGQSVGREGRGRHSGGKGECQAVGREGRGWDEGGKGEEGMQ